MAANNQKSGELERTLGLPAALAIGVGTMVGAGIFVFPGIAAGAAGPAAMVSFALGGCIALLVALSTAELATAMPQSGGGYYFISRTFGPLVGMVVGVGQWIGLVFASAFYLVGFGRYTADLLAEMGLSLGDPSILIGLGAALLLTAVNLLGTEGAGDLQNGIVITLTAILGMLFLYGVLNAVGLIGRPQWPRPFAPQGVMPIFTTTALIFTSYLGFVQIATVAGEVREPHRTLPRALMGSVLIVTGLYVLALFVSTSVLPTARLAELGETAMVEVARSLVGGWGALIVMGAGLLATLSSANASILSSSRALYALSHDHLLPPVMSRVNGRFGTPHIALPAVGLPIAALTLLGRVEVLAEVASLLHLIIYGLICAVLIVLRRRRPRWYAPTFYAPGGLAVPAVGMLASFGLIALMRPLSLLIGGGVVMAALLWYAVYARGRELPTPQPPHIVPKLRTPRILIPLQLPNPAPLPEPLLNAFHDLELFVLGYQIVPEQTSPEQAREEAGDEAREALDEITADLKNRGINVREHLVFTPDLAQTLDRYVRDKNCHAVLTAAPIVDLKRLLVPIYTTGQMDVRAATVLRDLSLSSQAPVTLLALNEEETEQEVGDTTAEKRQRLARKQLERVGLSRDQIKVANANVKNVARAITQMADEKDIVILDEPDDADRAQLFSTLNEEVLDALACPTLVVLREHVERPKD